MLRKIMLENRTLWKAQRLCDELCKTIPFFSYFIHVDDRCNGPDSILQMTPSMRNNLIKFPDILCLDMQKRQFNGLNWP